MVQDRPLRTCRSDSGLWVKPLKLLIFDCDGTLVDSQHKICAAMQAAYSAQGLPTPARERLVSIVGLSLTEAFTALGEGADGYPVQSLIAQYRAASSSLRASQIAWEPLSPGARETIESLAARPDIVLGIATGKSRRGVDAVLGSHGLRDHFVTIQTADLAPSKPHRAMVLQAMDETGLGAEDTVVIGDSIYDMAMARAAGALALGAGWGYHTPQALLAADAAVVLEGFDALMPVLEATWSDLACVRPGKVKVGHA
jgi:phosphoglycolate phosphatase